MNFAAILHEPKSRMSYACDGENLQLRIKVAKGDADRISVRAVDPYSWFPTKEDPSKYVFATEKIREFPMVKECSTEYHDVWFANIGNFPFSRIRYGFVLESGENRFLFLFEFSFSGNYIDFKISTAREDYNMNKLKLLRRRQ